jgi:hypothetical protein
MKKTSKPMQKNPALQSILNHLAGETVQAGEMDLWPSIRQRLAESTRSQAKETPMQTPLKNGPRLRLLGAAASLIVVLALLFATPQGQALAQRKTLKVILNLQGLFLSLGHKKLGDTTR